MKKYLTLFCLLSVLGACTEQPPPLSSELSTVPVAATQPAGPVPVAVSQPVQDALPPIALTGEPYADARAKLAPGQPYVYALESQADPTQTWQLKGKTDGRSHMYSYQGSEQGLNGEWLVYGHSAYLRNPQGTFVEKPFEGPGLTKLAELLGRLPAALSPGMRVRDDFVGAIVMARYELADGQGMFSFWLDEAKQELRQLRYSSKAGAMATLSLSALRTPQQIPHIQRNRGTTGFGPD